MRSILLLLFEEHGELKHSELADLLDVKDYASSGLLMKLETARHIGG
jgi:Mn-dependent DtxR family transcriptional regulator